MPGVKRIVKAAVSTYQAPDGGYRLALRGDEVEVHEEYVDRFDEFDVGPEPGEPVHPGLAAPEAELVESDAAPAAEDDLAGQPAGNASRADWAAFAASVGAPEEETAEGGLTRDELRDTYGN